VAIGSVWQFASAAGAPHSSAVIEGAAAAVVVRLGSGFLIAKNPSGDVLAPLLRNGQEGRYAIARPFFNSCLSGCFS